MQGFAGVGGAQPFLLGPNGREPFDGGHLLADSVGKWRDARANFFTIE
jgi:hypothetical protein